MLCFNILILLKWPRHLNIIFLNLFLSWWIINDGRFSHSTQESALNLHIVRACVHLVSWFDGCRLATALIVLYAIDLQYHFFSFAFQIRRFMPTLRSLCSHGLSPLFAIIETLEMALFLQIRFRSRRSLIFDDMNLWWKVLFWQKVVVFRQVWLERAREIS